MSDEATVRAALRRLKIFPLPDAALLPGGSVGLHVFEPRYRALVRTALATDRVLAIPMLAPGWEGDYEGAPAVRPIAGAGIIEHSNRLPDGRYNIQVRGVMRVRVLREAGGAAEGGYREVVAEELQERPAVDLRQLDTVRSCILELCHALPPDLAEPLAEEVAVLDDPGKLCDVAASDLLIDPATRQAILEAMDVERRMELMVSELSGLLVQIRGMVPGSMLPS